MIKSIYIGQFFITGLVSIGLLFLFAYFFPLLLPFVKILFYAFCLLSILDVFLLYKNGPCLYVQRTLSDKFSNGDLNEVKIIIESKYPFDVWLKIIDEIPVQFQERNIQFEVKIAPGESKLIIYRLRPNKRGEYLFENINVFVQSAISLVNRRYSFALNKKVAVYPSFIQMHKYELLALSNRLHEVGIKKIRRLGHNIEFEQIREYVSGDDFRTINWKATARKNDLMINQYQDEKSQEVYCIIDKGRCMKMPFNQMSLLDYAINAALVISNIAIKKGDKAGLISFSNNIETIIKAGNRGRQMLDLSERLYHEETLFLESDYEKLFVSIRRKLNRRSLLLLFSNFETLSALKRQLPNLRRIAHQHLLVVIFFENTELEQLLTSPVKTIEQVYLKTIAEKFAFEKKLIVKELLSYGIYSILTSPELLTVNTINKYLELKARGLI